MVIDIRAQIVLFFLYLEYYLRDWDINILIFGSELMETPKPLCKNGVSKEREREEKECTIQDKSMHQNWKHMKKINK